MEQRPSTAFTEREKEKKRQEIMNIQDRKKRHEAIARNMSLFTNNRQLRNSLTRIYAFCIETNLK